MRFRKIHGKRRNQYQEIDPRIIQIQEGIAFLPIYLIECVAFLVINLSLLPLFYIYQFLYLLIKIKLIENRCDFKQPFLWLFFGVFILFWGVLKDFYCFN